MWLKIYLIKFNFIKDEEKLFGNKEFKALIDTN
ncbi:hypothetical protein IWX83_002777 [Flavobacterium sp. CG_9.1]|jgi:hypothetical protein|nr:hypothetical protein [Flavobacterium sp. CG_9.1]